MFRFVYTADINLLKVWHYVTPKSQGTGRFSILRVIDTCVRSQKVFVVMR